MRTKPTGPPRNADIEREVVRLREYNMLEFSRIGKLMGFSRQRAHAIYSRAIYSRYINEVEESDE
ncbi:hypothetical protein LCGC14_0660080 [marine sediment metagenome]|uniref:RNA polymerase sigma-70 region 4 domain-containing protein n=1 Tax=marine sediment metagenome TaxID=412755 RepID=A0A0F9QTP2_9ZZZZ